MSETTYNQDTFLDILKDVAAKNVAAADVEAAVGQTALLHTQRPSGRDILRVADIGPDLAYQKTLPSLDEAQDVVYWRRADDEDDVKIAGLVWHDSHHVEVFCGIIYPPE